MSFVDAHDFSVGLVLRVLDIASSTYYEWRARAPARWMQRAAHRRATAPTTITVHE